MPPLRRRELGAGLLLRGICGEPECPADLNGDGQVNFTDLASVLSGWNTSDAGDANGDGVTNFEDLQLILSFWAIAKAPETCLFRTHTPVRQQQQHVVEFHG